MLKFCGRNAGLVVAVVVALLWWFAPSVELMAFKANQNMLLLIAYLLPASAGKFLSGLVELVQALQTTLSAPKLLLSQESATQFQATTAIIANTLLVLVEIKVIRWVVIALSFIPWPARRRVRKEPKFG